MHRLLALALVVCLPVFGHAAPPVVIETPVATLEGHQDILSWIQFSPDGKTLFSGAWGQSVRIWDLSQPRPMPLAKIDTEAKFSSAAISPDGSRLATVGTWERDTAPSELWDWKNNNREWNVDREAFAKITHGTVYSASFSPDGKHIVLGTAFEFPSQKRNGRAVLIDAQTGKFLRVLRKGGVVPDAEFSPDGKFIAISGGDSARIEVIDAESGSTVAFLGGAKNQYTGDLTFSPDWSLLATSGGEVYAYVWELPKFSRVPLRQGAKTQKPLLTLRARLRVSERKNRVDPPALSFSGDGKRLATGVEGEGVSIWDVDTGERLLEIRWTAPNRTYSDSSVTALAFSPDGKMIAVGGKDRLIRLFAFANELPTQE